MAAEARRDEAPATSSGAAFRLDRLGSGRDFSGTSYLEFMRTASLSVGMYVLAAGSRDGQQPHTEEEVYHVVEGKASLQVGGEDLAVGASTIAFVGAGVEHRFHSIEEDLKVLVFFAPAEHSLSPGSAT